MRLVCCIVAVILRQFAVVAVVAQMYFHPPIVGLSHRAVVVFALAIVVVAVAALQRTVAHVHDLH